MTVSMVLYLLTVVALVAVGWVIWRQRKKNKDQSRRRTDRR